jgi:hypothetical protein
MPECEKILRSAQNDNGECAYNLTVHGLPSHADGHIWLIDFVQIRLKTRGHLLRQP